MSDQHTEYQSQCLRIPLKPEGAAAFIAFARNLGRQHTTLAAVLAEEGMDAEAVFLEESADGSAIILFTKARDLAAASARFQNSTHPIQVQMRALMPVAFDLAGARPLEILLDATGPLPQDG